MVKAKADIKNLSVVEQIARGRKWEMALRGNPNLPAGVGDSLADMVKAVTDALEAAHLAKGPKEDAYRNSVTDETTASTAWVAMTPDLVSKVNELLKGNRTGIVSTGLDAFEDAHDPLPAPGKVMNLHASVGDEPGHVDLAWNGDENATAYADQIWQGDDVMAANWAYGAPLKGRKSKAEVLGLSSGLRYWFRVRASNTLDGPWSDPISIIAP